MNVDIYTDNMPQHLWCHLEEVEGRAYPYAEYTDQIGGVKYTASPAAGPWHKYPDIIPGTQQWVLRYRPNAKRKVTVAFKTAEDCCDWNDVTHWAEIRLPEENDG